LPDGLRGAAGGQAAQNPDEPPLYLLTYDHGGAILWETEKFAESLRSAVAWLERYPSFKMLPNFSGIATGVRDVPFGVAETADRYVQGIYWTALTDGQNGIGFFNRGAMGSVRESDGGFSLVLAYAANYVWRTVMLEGAYTYNFALWPFAGAWQLADLHRRALEYSFPLVAMGTKPSSGRLGSLVQPVAVDSPGAIVTALFPRDGQPHLRVFEHRGAPARVRLRGPRNRFTEVDLAGQSQGAVSSEFSLGPWQIRTLLLG
jgi:hypothetical protein